MVERKDLNCKSGLYRTKLTDLSQASQITSPTCKNLNNDYADVDQFVCSECGIELQDWDRVERDEDTGEESFYEYTLKYCPNCGRRIEYEG